MPVPSIGWTPGSEPGYLLVVWEGLRTNLSVATLAASTIVLTASTFYFARELGLERSRNVAAAADGTTPSATESVARADTAVTRGAARVPGSTPAGGNQPTSAAAAASRPDTAPDRFRERNRSQAEEFLRRYDNPETRAALLEEQLENQRRFLALLRPKLDLDEERWNKLLALINEQETDRRIRSARCLTDLTCLRLDLGSNYGEQQRQAVVDLIGEKNHDKLQEFRRDGFQADWLAKFQARLGPTLALSSHQMDELGSALGDEVRRTRREIESHGHETSMFSTRYGTVLYAKDTKTVEERMASATASVDHLRNRAGTLLNGEQLTIFNQLQDDSLLSFRPFARVGVAVQAQGYE